MLKFANQIIKF